MTTRQADKLIKQAEWITVRSSAYSETFRILILRRDRYSVYGITASNQVINGAFDRADLEVI